jgi:hypothetical protein
MRRWFKQLGNMDMVLQESLIDLFHLPMSLPAYEEYQDFNVLVAMQQIVMTRMFGATLGARVFLWLKLTLSSWMRNI